MLLFVKRMGIGLVTAGVMVGSMATPVLADTTVTVSGNGAGSANGVLVGELNVVDVHQSSTTVAFNKVEATASTGNNTVKGTTGGSVDVTTGDAIAKVVVDVTGGSNTAVVDPCACTPEDLTVNVKNNGVKSKNGVVVFDLSATKVSQKTSTVAFTGASANGGSGYNKVTGTTGKKADVTVKTGDVSSKVKVTVSGGSNTLNP